MSASRAVLFDLDETLVNRREGLIRFATQLWQEGLVHDECEADFVQDFLLLDNLGSTPRAEFFRLLTRKHMPAVDAEILLERFLSEAWLAPQLFPDAVDTLRALEARGWKVGIVSNGSSRTQREKINRTALKAWGHLAVISEEFGSKKPDPAIYAEALARLGAEAAESWFVGDCAVNDVVGAASAGLHAIWLERHGSWPEQYERVYAARVTKLREVLDVIRD